MVWVPKLGGRGWEGEWKQEEREGEGGGGDGSTAASPSREACAGLLLELCTRLGLAPEQGQCGSTKVFLRAELGATLD